MQTHECYISNLDDVSETIVVQLKCNEPLSPFRAGQYLLMALDGETFRPFSIASVVAENTLELHIRDNPDHHLRKTLHDKFEHKGKVSIQLPAGRCTLRRTELNKPLIFIAGGTGYAPCHAMLQELFAMDKVPAVHLYWGGARLVDLYFHTRLQKLSSDVSELSYVPVVQFPETDEELGMRNGFVHEAVLEDLNDLANYDIFISGSGPMVGAVHSALVKAGADADSIFSDMLDLGLAVFPK